MNKNYPLNEKLFVKIQGVRPPLISLGGGGNELPIPSLKQINNTDCI